MASRATMCDWFSDQIERYPNGINSLWYSDEAHYHLTKAINNHNNVWGAEPPEKGSEMSHKSPKPTCFCALNTRLGMLGPYWFKDANSKTVTINGERYHEVLCWFHADLAQLPSPNQLRLAWFIQDGAPLHNAGEATDLLHQPFGNHVISLGTAHEWGAPRPGFESIDFYILGGAAKGQVYPNKPRTLAVLKQEVEDYHQATTPATCRWVVENFGVRTKACLNRGRAHIENVNYKQYNEWFENGMVYAFHQCITELATFCTFSVIKCSNRPLFWNALYWRV